MEGKKTARLSQEDLVYRTSRWQRYLYETERDVNKGLKQAEVKGVGRAERYPDYQRELFSRLYNPKTKKLDAPAENSEWAEKLHGTAQDMPEFKALQTRCKGNEMWSGMATSTLSQTISATMQERKSKQNTDDLEKRVQGLMDMAEKGINVDKRLKKAQKQLEKAKQEAQEMADGMDPVAIRQAVRQACEKAQDEIEEAEQAIESFSYGDQPGAPARLGNTEAKRALAKKISNSHKLKKIAKLAGRMRRIAAEKQRSKASDCREEVTDIEQGSDLNRLLPSELMDLLNGDGGEREAMFWARFLDRQCLQYKLSGKEKEGQGPIVICMDESGSMSGDREVWAKAVAMALLDVAKRQKRSWSFIHFSYGVDRVDTFEKGEVSTEKLMECMEHFSGGGTNFTQPLEAAVEVIRKDKEFKKADILLVTDGCCHTDAAWNERFKAVKKELGFSLYSVLVQTDETYFGPVKGLSDQVFSINELVEDSFQEVVFKM